MKALSKIILRGCFTPLLSRGVVMKLLLFVFVSLLTTHYSLLFSQVTATFSSDSSKIEIGDHLGVKLVLNTEAGDVINFPTFPGDSIGKVDIIRKSKIDTAKVGNKVIYSQDLIMSAYDAGRYGFAFRMPYFNKATGTVDTISTNQFEFTAIAPAVDTTKPIKPIKAPLKVDYKLNEFTAYIIALLGLIILLVIAYFYYKRYKNKPAPVIARPKPKEPAHIWANKELKKLEQEKLWQSDKVKEYHSRLTDILRLYLEFQFNYYAMEATSEEIMSEVYRLDIGMDAGSKLREILSLADFVKFAKMNPAPDQNTRSIQNALEFVEMTKPKIEEPINNNKPNK